MNETTANHYYKLIFDSINEDTLKIYVNANNYLKKNDWLFISPLFFQGYELRIFDELSRTEKNNKDKILEIIIRKFYNLNYIASFVDGYCFRSEYTKSFAKSIETSIILTFQKDYEGSIKTIIPIIEGILRKYLISDKGYSTENIRSRDLQNSFDYIRNDLIVLYKERLNTYHTLNNSPVKFSQAQIESLTSKQEKYYNTWFSFVNDFVRNSFYLNTRGQSITTEVNRHAILHEFGLKFEYSFENYIKIFFLLQFLTWALLQKENKSILNESGLFRSFEKIIAYRQIIRDAEKSAYEKHILLKDHDNYTKIHLEKNMLSYVSGPSQKHLVLYRLLKKIHSILPQSAKNVIGRSN